LIARCFLQLLSALALDRREGNKPTSRSTAAAGKLKIFDKQKYLFILISISDKYYLQKAA
jgi:hypothetical protein